MNQERWNAVDRIFQAALETEPDKRSHLIARLVQGDTDLQAEVEALLKADDEAGSYLRSPALPIEALHEPSAPVAAGDVLCDRFHLVRELGKGGMGYVFEAFDSELGVTLALKLIRPEIAAHPGAVDRFRQEARLARSVTHPNICRTFDFEREVRKVNGRTIELFFLTMQFLQGETLSARIKRDGALSPPEALIIAVQVAAALQAAHAEGIIHRDIKPANILLLPPPSGSTEGIRAVVTDFGLARVDRLFHLKEDQSLTGTGQVLGTLDYMAPEQLEGTTVSKAADIYAFGLVLFEMITGTRAFPSENFLGGIARRLRGSVSLHGFQDKNVPPGWRIAVAACLQLSPDLRPHHANDVLALLEESEHDKHRGAFMFNTSIRTVSRVPLIKLAIFLGVMALLAIGFRFYQTRTPSGVDPGALVYLAPVRNRTGEKRFDAMTELIQASLSQSVQINLLDQGRVDDILQGMARSAEEPSTDAIAREIAMRAGARRVVLATLTGGNGKYCLALDIQQPDNSPTRYRRHSVKAYCWQSPSTPAGMPPDLLSSVRSASNWIRQQTGESAQDIAQLDVPPEDVTTANWQALSEYSNGERFAAQVKPEEALLSFREATAYDANFALAYARQGDLLVSMNHQMEGYDAYNLALEVDLGRRLTRRERDFIKGSYASDTGDYSAAEAAFRDLSEFYDNDFRATFFRAFPLRMMGRFQEALGVLQRAHDLSPSSGGVWMGMAYNQMLLRDFAAAHQSIDHLRNLGNHDDVAMLSGHLAFLENKPEEAASMFASLRDAHDPHQISSGYALRARLQAEHGMFSEALQELDAGIENDDLRASREPQGMKLLDKAYLLCRLKQYSPCFAAIQQSLQMTSRQDCLIRASDILGRALGDRQITPSLRSTLMGQLRSLKSALPVKDYGPNFQIAGLRIQGEILLAEGKPQLALIVLRKAAVLESPITDRGYLARALVAEAARRGPGPQANAQREEALSLRAHMALNPQLIWNYSLFYPPGFLADEMSDFLRLSDELGSKDDRKAVLASYRKLRPSSPPPS